MKPEKKMITVRIPVDLAERFQKYIDGAPRQVTKESVIQEALKRELDRRKRAAKK